MRFWQGCKLKLTIWCLCCLPNFWAKILPTISHNTNQFAAHPFHHLLIDADDGKWWFLWCDTDNASLICWNEISARGYKLKLAVFMFAQLLTFWRNTYPQSALISHHAAYREHTSSYVECYFSNGVKPWWNFCFQPWRWWAEPRSKAPEIVHIKCGSP
jgi:hypothetical protein